MPKFGTLPSGRSPGFGNVVEQPQNRAPLERGTIAPPSFSSPGAADTTPSEGGFSIPLAMASILIVLFIGRPFDQFLTGYHIPAVICSIGIVVTLFTKWPAALTSRSGIGLSLFLTVMCAASVFSSWRSGSLQYLQGYVEFNLVLFCLIAATPKSLGNIRWLIFLVVASCALNCAMGARFDAAGRLQFTDETLGNSDDVALLGGYCLPFVLLIASRLGKVFGTLFGLAGTIGCLALIELSATRFAFISMAAMVLTYFMRASGKQRFSLILGMGLVVVASIFLLPTAILTRLSTFSSILHSDEAVVAESANGGGEAIDSLQERRKLVVDGLDAFFTHPVLGVGPEQFANWRWENKHAPAMPTHNTYLQTGAEEGFLGLAFYLAFNIGGLVTLYKCAKPLDGWRDGQQIAIALESGLVYFLVSAAFITCVAHPIQFIIAGLAVALERVRNQQLASATAQEVASKALDLPPAPSLHPRSVAPPAPERSPRYRFNRPSTPTRRS